MERREKVMKKRRRVKIPCFLPMCQMVCSWSCWSWLYIWTNVRCLWSMLWVSNHTDQKQTLTNSNEKQQTKTTHTQEAVQTLSHQLVSSVLHHMIQSNAFSIITILLYSISCFFSVFFFVCAVGEYHHIVQSYKQPWLLLEKQLHHQRVLEHHQSMIQSCQLFKQQRTIDLLAMYQWDTNTAQHSTAQTQHRYNHNTTQHSYCVREHIWMWLSRFFCSLSFYLLWQTQTTPSLSLKFQTPHSQSPSLASFGNSTSTLSCWFVSLPLHSLYTHSLHTLSTHTLYTLSLHTLSTHSLHTLSIHSFYTLSIHSLYTLSAHTLFIHSLYTLSLYTLSTHSLHRMSMPLFWRFSCLKLI